MQLSDAPPHDRRAAMMQAAAVTGLGLALLALAYTQPAWLGARIGPGLFAQWLAKAVVALGAAMGGLAVAGRLRGARLPAVASLASGITVLAGVALFAWLARDAGLVLCCAVAAAMTGWAAGERRMAAVAGAAGVGAAAAVAIGYTLLPEAAPLWP